MEIVQQKSDVPRLEDAFCCRVTCTECMEAELKKIDPLTACNLVCSPCMEKEFRNLE
ncbi:MAG: hypothetical protein HXS46_05200 [Theionarchaea archaeon]|nr:hypothetical protein [Theionarchaea archaeon]